MPCRDSRCSACAGLWVMWKWKLRATGVISWEQAAGKGQQGKLAVKKLSLWILGVQTHSFVTALLPPFCLFIMACQPVHPLVDCCLLQLTTEFVYYRGMLRRQLFLHRRSAGSRPIYWSSLKRCQILIGRDFEGILQLDLLWRDTAPLMIVQSPLGNVLVKLQCTTNTMRSLISNKFISDFLQPAVHIL